MGWFGSDDITNNVTNTTHDTLQTIALAIIALVILAYGVLKVCNNHHRNQSERVANVAIKMSTVSV